MNVCTAGSRKLGISGSRVGNLWFLGSSGFELQDSVVPVFEATFCLTLVKKNRHIVKRKKRSGYVWEKAEP